jgi:CCR4-NOT transcription complex subunit 7/8
MYAQDSIDMLIRSGIDFTKHEEHGIDVTHFGELLTSSGMSHHPHCVNLSA